jgi:uncharacterized membrane protein YhaH (DUF805 family)
MFGLDQWQVIYLLYGLLLVLSLRSIWRSRVHSRKAKILWTVLCLLPVIGPVAWFIIGIQRMKR